jgi:hypothetical protein
MDRFVSLIILVVKAGSHTDASSIRNGSAMPILIWIATIACMLEIVTVHAPGQTQKDVSARNEKDLDQQHR